MQEKSRKNISCNEPYRSRHEAMGHGPRKSARAVNTEELLTPLRRGVAAGAQSTAAAEADDRGEPLSITEECCT